MKQEFVRRQINKGKSKKPQGKAPRPVPKAVLKLLEAMGRIELPVLRASRYTPHQGPRECARRVWQMQKTTTTS